MDIEKLVDSIIADRITVKELDTQQMEAVIDFMRDHISTMSNEDLSEALLQLVDVIEDAAEIRFVHQDLGDWEETIEASMARGNTYFELENYVIQ